MKILGLDVHTAEDHAKHLEEVISPIQQTVARLESRIRSLSVALVFVSLCVCAGLFIAYVHS